MATLDVTLEQGALSDEARSTLVDELSAMLAELEGARDGRRPVPWCFVDEQPPPGGVPSARPLYRIAITLPARAARACLPERVTELVLRAEGTPVTALDTGRVQVEVREAREDALDGLVTSSAPLNK